MVLAKGYRKVLPPKNPHLLHHHTRDKPLCMKHRREMTARAIHSTHAELLANFGKLLISRLRTKHNHTPNLRSVSRICIYIVMGSP
jgi:hypothetical protein